MTDTQGLVRTRSYAAQCDEVLEDDKEVPTDDERTDPTYKHTK